VRAPAWLATDGAVTAVLRKEELAGLFPGERAVFFRATAPSVGIDVRLGAAPPLPWDGPTARVQFRLKTRGSVLRPGQVGWVRIAPRPRELLVIPSSALLYSSAGPYVLAAGADNRTLSKRRVEIGTVSRGFAVVLTGLREGEPIVVGSAFSWDAERRLQPRNEEIAGVAR
jgi:multidrug efflux pump subunit AcrA (membrane-fusion protein)